MIGSLTTNMLEASKLEM